MPSVEFKAGQPVELVCDCGHRFKRYRSEMRYIDGGVCPQGYKTSWYENLEAECPECKSKISVQLKG